MAYDEQLAARIRRAIGPRPDITEKKMFGGVAFLQRGKMFCGLATEDLMVRIGPERYEAALAEAHVRPMDFTGRPMKGYVFVAPAGTRTEKAVKRWTEQAIAFVATLDETVKRRKQPSNGSGAPRSAKKAGRSTPSRLNAGWHERHPMPKNPTTEQRLTWHTAHARNCGCRPMPAKLRAMLK
jgi:TfoX/Sxy family transcriptional regulator of competence genes